jgi:hypothetical protein
MHAGEHNGPPHAALLHETGALFNSYTLRQSVLQRTKTAQHRTRSLLNKPALGFNSNSLLSPVVQRTHTVRADQGAY